MENVPKNMSKTFKGTGGTHHTSHKIKSAISHHTQMNVLNHTHIRGVSGGIYHMSHKIKMPNRTSHEIVSSHHT